MESSRVEPSRSRTVIRSRLSPREVGYAALTRALDKIESYMMPLDRAIRKAKYRSFLHLAHRPRPDDIYIVSFPKSGTTAMQMILHHVVGDASMDFRHIDAVVPWFENRFLSDYKYYDALPSPRAFKSHLKISELPRGASYIYLLRNPKDACVSYYYHLSSIASYRAPLATFVDRFVKGQVGIGSWFEHLKSCSAQLQSERVLIVNYDDIATNLPGVIDRVSAFCGRSLDAKAREIAISRCGFRYMKEHNERFDPRYVSGPPRVNNAQFIRRGVPGDWTNELSPQQAASIDARLRLTLDTLASRLSEKDIASLFPRASTIRGILRIEVRREDVTRNLVLENGGVRGGRFVVGPEPLNIGDEVRLELTLGRDARVTIPSALIVSAGDGMAELRFAQTTDDDTAKLLAFRETAEST